MPVLFSGTSTTTYSSGETIGPCSSRAACLESAMRRVCSCDRPLPISSVAPLRSTMATWSEPEISSTALEAFGDGQHADEHGDDAGDADERHDRTTRHAATCCARSCS